MDIRIILIAMSLSYIPLGAGAAATGGMMITGLSSDTKPATPLSNWIFVETDTGKLYNVNAGAWQTTNNAIIPAGFVTNAMLAGSIAYSKLLLTGAILNADLAGSIAYSKLLLTGAILNADLAGSIDLLTKVANILPFANGGESAAAAAPATTGTMSVPMTSSIITITPTGACTFNASGGTRGQTVSFFITTSGTTSFTLTWGTNFRKIGTLATGTTSARFFSVTFRCLDGTIWQEIARTAVQT